MKKMVSQPFVLPGLFTRIEGTLFINSTHYFVELAPGCQKSASESQDKLNIVQTQPPFKKWEPPS